jgi:hypothetical protein
VEKNPYSDGKIRGHADAIIRAIVVGTAIVVAWNAPYAWYWRIGIFVAIMFVLGIIYPAIQRVLAERREQRYRTIVRQHNPEIADSMEATDEFVKTMKAMSGSYRDNPAGQNPGKAPPQP